MNASYMFLVTLFMIFFHIVDDFYLQGCLAKMKQKSFWDKNTIYRNDWAVCLVTHGMSWSIMVHIPIMVATLVFFRPEEHGILYLAVYISVFANALIHAIIDNLKCNAMKINLWTDQCLHIIQVSVVSFSFFLLTMKI